MNNVLLEIVNLARANKKLEEVAKEVNYSTKQVTRLCEKAFKQRYTMLRKVMVFSEIIEMILLQNKTQEKVAEELSFSDVVQLRHFVKSFNNQSLTQIKREGAVRMNKPQIMALESQTISRLFNTQNNLTIKQLDVPYSIISGLRKKGFDIISVPGRNGGYNLDVQSKQKCLTWINNIRVNRFGILGNYTF